MKTADLEGPALEYWFKLAVAVQGTDGRFTFAQYPECIDVEMDIEIRG